MVVVGAGNDNKDAAGMNPAGIPAAITVSAITDINGKCGGGRASTQHNGVRNPDDYIASYSNFGTGVDFAAPGTDIRSTWKNSGYRTESGTRRTAPHVAGAVALIKSLSWFATPADIETILHNDATKAPPPVPGVAPVSPLQPCDGKGRGYFEHLYSPPTTVRPTTGHHEDLLYMGNINTDALLSR